VSAALFESIARIARHEAGARATAGVGKVVDLFTADGPVADHAVSVEMRDSGLVLPRVPVAVGVMGFAAIPAIDDLVLVVFLDGDYNAPVVVGRLYHPDQDPPEHGRDQIVLGLPSGSNDPDLRLLLESAEPSILLTLPGDVKLEIKDGVVTIAVGEMHVELRGSGGGRAEIAAGGAKLTLKQDGDVTIESPSTLALKASTIDIKADASVTIKGATVEIN
jgi:uncharacterized protein involved in type VI secretion and phage assembly